MGNYTHLTRTDKFMRKIDGMIDSVVNKLRHYELIERPEVEIVPEKKKLPEKV